MMKNTKVSYLIQTAAITLSMLAAVLVFGHVRADVAPPESPPGTNIVPGNSATRVRMLSETVTLIVLSQPAAGHVGQAKTEARFTMRNLGDSEENIEVRFPLTFFDGNDNGFGNFTEIADIHIEVNGQTVSTRRIESSYTRPDGTGATRPTPWAAFNIAFPPGKDVGILVNYTSDGFGYAPYYSLRYVVETGAAWNGTIGSADVIVKLPYEASAKNILMGEGTSTTPGAELSGQEVRWHFEDFEPTLENNIQITLLQSAVWRNILNENDNVMHNPADGEAWGRLGKSYKEIVRLRRAFRPDPGGLEMYNLASQAYDKAVTLLPNDALWHYGFADLLWSHYDYLTYVNPQQGYAEISRAADEIRKSLALDPNNQDAILFAQNIASMYPWAIAENGADFNYPILTATPTNSPITETPTTSPAQQAQQLSATSTAEPKQMTPTAQATDCSTPDCKEKPSSIAIPATKTTSLPFCSGSLLLLPFLAGFFYLFLKR
jgi:tetratricopeptide (TPR) repeat protein